ncbi:MAG: ABC transporter ATP-binding protein [Pseudomonadales bacterium]
MNLTIDQQSVLTNISCTIGSGEIVVVCGDHESGKTALLHALAGDIPACRSQVRHQGQAIIATPAQVVLAQRPATPTDQTVSDVIGDLGQVTEFEIDGLSQRLVKTLSRGERRWVELAQAWAQIRQTNDELILFLDEPLQGLDQRKRALIIDLIQQSKSEGMAVLIALNDLAVAKQVADRVLLLKSGQMLAQGSPDEVLTPALLQAAFETNVLSS